MGLLTERNVIRCSAEGENYPFPTRVLVRELEHRKGAGPAADPGSLYRRVIAECQWRVPREKTPVLDPREAGAKPIVRSTRGPARAGRAGPRPPRSTRPALADHPSEADLPILVAALASRDPEYDKPGDKRLAQDRGQAAGPRGAGQPDPSGPAVRGRLAARCSTSWRTMDRRAEARRFGQLREGAGGLGRRLPQAFSLRPPPGGDPRRPGPMPTIWASSWTTCSGAT